MKKYLIAAAVVAVASPAWAAMTNVDVTNLSSPVPAGTSWGVIPGENSAGATTEIVAGTSNDGDGSLQISGDRTRVQTGVQYGGGTDTGILANSLVSLGGDYLVTDAGTRGIQSPAFRILVQDGSQRSELIWEAAYNGGVVTDAWTTMTDPNALFWQYIGGSGSTFVAGTSTYVSHTLAQWGDLYSSTAFVSGISVGDGSGAGSSFNAYVDHVALTTDSGTTMYNFKAAVPEPATWGMMLLGFGGIGMAMRRSRKPVLSQIA
jgi:hypothetical protein